MGYVHCELLGAAVFFSMRLLFTAAAAYMDAVGRADQVNSGTIF